MLYVPLSILLGSLLTSLTSSCRSRLCRRERPTPLFTFGYSTNSRGTTRSNSFSSFSEISSQVRTFYCRIPLNSLLCVTLAQLTLKLYHTTDREDRIPLFSSSSSDSPYPPLLKFVTLSSLGPLLFCSDLCSCLHRLLDSQDDFVRLKAAVIASVLLSYDKSPQDDVVSKLLSHLSHLIRELPRDLI